MHDQSPDSPAVPPVLESPHGEWRPVLVPGDLVDVFIEVLKTHHKHIPSWYHFHFHYHRTTASVHVIDIHLEVIGRAHRYVTDVDRMHRPQNLIPTARTAVWKPVDYWPAVW